MSTPSTAWTTAIAKGVRAAVSTLIPFFLAAQLGRAELGWMALGGWLGTLADPGGLRTTRMQALASFAVLGACLVALSERCATSIWLATPVLAAVAFAGTLARALGPASATVGTMLAIVTAVGAAARGSHAYAADALAFFAGATWATLLSSVVWSVDTHRPARQAIAEVFAELAGHAAAVEACAERTEAGTAWTALARTHHRRIRAAIEAALGIALSIRADRPGESSLGGDLRVLLGMAEAQFPELIALAMELEATPVVERPPYVLARLRAIAASYEAVSRALVAARSRSPGATTPVPTPPSSSEPADVLSQRLLEESERALRFTGSLGTGVALPPEGQHAASWREGLRDQARKLRDGLSVDSVFFRHALRVAAAAAAASLLGHRIATHSHWVTVTTLAVLQPYPGPTSTRAAERVVGTVLGSLLAAVITMTVHAPLALAAIMFPLSVAAVATRSRSYRLFTFFLTPVFVLIAEHHPGDWWTAAARAGDAVAGGAVALVAALVVWPSWERKRLPEALEAMITAVLRYHDIVIARLDREAARAAADQVAAARRAAGVAIGEAETSLERLLAEPLRRGEEGEDAMQLVTHARRLTNACTTLHFRVVHDVAASGAARDEQLHIIAEYAESVQRRASQAPPGGDALPAGGGIVDSRALQMGQRTRPSWRHIHPRPRK